MTETETRIHTLSARSTHRSPSIVLPADAEHAAAYVLSFVQSADPAFDRSAALEGLNERIDKLQHSTADVVEKELFAHSQILQALFYRYTAQSVSATLAEHKAIYLKLGVTCQAAYVKAVVCIEGLRMQRQGSGLIRSD